MATNITTNSGRLPNDPKPLKPAANANAKKLNARPAAVAGHAEMKARAWPRLS
ncbi:MAG TPA: hypothetical protein VGG18_06290 [Granulicella sp.]